MSALRTLIARWLLAVMLATVFSPSFGWELVEGAVPHAHSEQAADGEEHHADHHDHGLASTSMHAANALHAADDCSGCGDLTAGDCSDGQHHCCPGHVLGHLPASLRAVGVFVLALNDSFALDGAAARFSTRIPEGLERPPRAAA
jgi:hypothetical protein